MANDLNLCQFIGRLGKDPETRYMPNGDAVTSFSIACGWKSKEKEGTEWVNCSAFGKLAEICGEYLKKGSQVYVSGRMTTRKYEKNGQDHYATQINLEQMQMLGGKPEGQEKTADKPKANKQQFSDLGDDIPF